MNWDWQKIAFGAMLSIDMDLKDRNMGRAETKKNTSPPRTKSKSVGIIDFDEEMRAMRRFAKRVGATRETAFEYLVKHGYVTPKGKITKRYK